jgi:hypothetical protein
MFIPISCWQVIHLAICTYHISAPHLKPTIAVTVAVNGVLVGHALLLVAGKGELFII